MGVSNNITMLHGWSEKGKRSYSEQEGFATERVNIVAGYNAGTKELIAPLEHSGYMDTQLFNQWVGELLCPSLKPGQFVIMDNASIHKSPLVKELIEKAGFALIYLPVYSPDLNSIEHCWANFKNYLRKIIKNFRDAITAAMVKTFPCKLYLPTYSPDLNPIEHCWANLKNYLRTIIKQFKDLRCAITAAMSKTFPC